MVDGIGIALCLDRFVGFLAVDGDDIGLLTLSRAAVFEIEGKAGSEQDEGDDADQGGFELGHFESPGQVPERVNFSQRTLIQIMSSVM